jgi:hypothetical protein
MASAIALFLASWLGLNAAFVAIRLYIVYRRGSRIACEG